MICRLIQKKDMRLVPSNHSKRDSGLLTSREEIHWSKGQIARNTESTKMLSQLLGCLIWVLSHQLFKSRELLIKHVHMMLSKDTHFELTMDESVAVKHIDLADQ